MEGGKQRHGCLTAWLVFLILANAATGLTYAVGGEAVRETLPDLPGWATPVLGGLAVVNLVCAFALFLWKKWGFWGFCGTSAVALVLNLSFGLGIGPSLLGLLGIVLLYGVLQIGQENKGWPQLD